MTIFTPIGFKALSIFTFHMIQHICMLMLVGPLLVLATTENFRKTLNSYRWFRILTGLKLSFALYCALMVGIHLSPIHLKVMHNPWIHYFIELPLYLIIPYIFYFNLIDSNLIDRRVSTGVACIALWLMMVPETLTGFFIYISNTSAYENMYDINDQRLGGTIMWSGGMIIDTLWILMAVYHWYKSEELKNA